VIFMNHASGAVAPPDTEVIHPAGLGNSIRMVTCVNAM